MAVGIAAAAAVFAENGHWSTVPHGMTCDSHHYWSFCIDIICQCESGPDDAHASSILIPLNLLHLQTPYILDPALMKPDHVQLLDCL